MGSSTCWDFAAEEVYSRWDIWQPSSGRFHQRLPGCTLRRAGRLRLTSGVAVPYQLDGDPGGELPLELQVLPARLTLVIPEATAQK